MTRLTAALVLLLAAPSAATATLTTYRISPQDTDAAISRFNEPHVVVFDREAAPPARLLLFMPGTATSPASIDDFLTLAATLGYRVVSLSYNNLPAVVDICPKDPDAACSGKFRQERTFGEDVTAHIDDKPEESIVSRVVKLLVTLDKEHPSENWRQYLDGDAPRWDRIAVAGHSQGAGMAAYIAQRKHVVRVVLLSGPWDFYGARGEERLAPWIRGGNGATPAAFWFGAYHKKENTAPRIVLAYKALNIPDAHMRVLTLEPALRLGNNPYHLSVVVNRATPRNEKGVASYEDDWRFLLQSPD
jgi:hypothetical protein